MSNKKLMSLMWVLRNQLPVECDDVVEWENFYRNIDARRVAVHEIDRVQVSTVFLGMNHAWLDGPPMFFESMVFNGPMHHTMVRYSTYKQAQLGHALLCVATLQALDDVNKALKAVPTNVT